MLKPMNTRKKIAFSTLSQPPHWDLWRKEGSLELGVNGQKYLFLWSITSDSSFICSAGGLRGFSLNFLILKHLLLFLGITQQSTSRWIWWCQKDRIITIQQLTLAKRGGPSLTHRPCPTANPWKEGQTRAELFHWKSSQYTQIFPSRTLRACPLPKQKTQRLCVSSGVK